MPTHFHVAVRRPGDGAILVLRDGAMPGFTAVDAPAWPVVSPIVERLRAEHGLDVVALRAAWVGAPDPTTGRDDRLYEAVHVGGALPRGASWVAPAALERRPTALGRAIETGALDSLAADRQPWYAEGWLADMTNWIDAQLRERGSRRHGAPRQVRSWGRSGLLAVETDHGRFWAKQVPAVFVHEVTVTALLADIDPGIVPPLIAADARNGRLLMEHVDGPILADEPDATDAWLATAARLAEIQRVMRADVRSLEVAGVPRASLASLAERIPTLLAERALLRVGEVDGLTPGEVAALEAAVPDLVAACAALQASDVGSSLEHGDLSAGQVIVSAMGPVFLDWSDSTIAHPFLSAASFLDDARGVSPSLRTAFTEAYLAGFHDAGGAASTSSLRLAQVVHPLHMAQAFADRILPALEQPWELADMTPRLLRGLLGRLSELPDILGS